MWIEILLLFFVLFLFLYRFITKDFNFFDGQGIPVMKPSFPFGSSCVRDMFLGKCTFVDLGDKIVEQFPNEKIIGYFMFQTPRYFFNDEELTKKIMIKDFEYFTDRPVTNTSDPISNNFMTNLEGNEWKKMRALMSGVFTSGKLKGMLPHLKTAGKNLEKHIEKLAESGEEADMKEAGGLFTLDSIAAAGFGIDINSFEDPENVFRVMAMRLVNAPGYQKQSMLMLMLKMVVIKACPKLGNDILKLSLFDKESVDFFSDIIKRTYVQRKASGQRRNDFIDLIIDEVKKSEKGEAVVREEPQDEFEADAALDVTNIEKTDLDDETLLISNVLLFFFAGFDTSAFGIGTISHKLCIYPEEQEKVYEEIIDVFGADGEVTFDKLNELKYMDKFISESLRHSGVLVPTNERTCTKNYKIPDTDIVIPKGVVVNMYNIEMMMKDGNFSAAKEFDPENFNPENNPNKFAYQTFGQGPRSCIGMRYALLNLKISLVYMLRKFKIIRGKTMETELRMTNELTHFIGGLPATFEKRD